MFLFNSANDLAFSLKVLMFCCVASIAASVILFCIEETFAISSVVSRITFSVASGTLVVIPAFLAYSLCSEIEELIVFLLSVGN